MTTNSISASENPALVNDLISQAVAQTQPEVEEPTLTPPSDTLVALPAGYITPDGEVIKTAEVRELTGKDEEAIARATSVSRMLLTILHRGTVAVGNLSATDEVLDGMLTGDRDALLLGIYRATFGDTAEIKSYCAGCDDYKDVEVNVLNDIKTKLLADHSQRTFDVKGRKHVYTVSLPTGITARELANNDDKNISELTSLLLEQTVLEIDGNPVLSKLQVQNIGVVDRRKIGDAIAERNPGPRFEDTSVICPDCEGKVVVPISFGTLFQF